MIISTSVAVILLHLTILSAAQDPADCTEGDVEFVGLSVNYAGIVRVCNNGVWGTICADEFTPWSEKNCQVACRSAGYSGAVNPILQETINAVIRETVTDDPIHYRSVRCDGSESSITQCPSSDITGSCIHNYDAAVTCRSYPDSSATAGDVRLLGDSRDGMGAVEYYDTFLGWTGVCVDSTYSAAWLENSAAARIVCTQLGYEGGDPDIQTGVSTTDLPRRSAGFLTCTEGTDFNLGSCRRTTAVCDASTISAGGVMCTKTVTEDGSVRLVGGNDRAGVVEVAYNGRWGTLCEDDSWDTVDATVVCSQLGLSDGDPVTLSGSYPDYHRTSAKPSWLSAVECASTETGLSECPHSLPIGYTTCTVSSSAELSCGSAPVDEGGLNGGAVAGIVIGSLIGLSVIGWLIYIFDKDKKRKQAAATVTRPHPPAPAPAPARQETRHASGTVPATTVSHVQQQQQEPPSQPTADFTVAAPPTYQVAVAYPTATPQAPPTYTDKTGAYPAPSPAYPPPTPSAPPAAGLSFGDYPPYPDQAYNPAFPPPAAPAQPDFPQLFR